jgi:hypothetical protein
VALTDCCLYEGSCLIHVICACLHIVVSNTYCVVFLFFVFLSRVPVSLDCPFLIALSVFSNVYLLITAFETNDITLVKKLFLRKQTQTT